MNELYPEIEPNQTFFLEQDGHRIYVEDCGNPDGIAVVFLHGGPGSGCKSYHRQFFNPEIYRIVIFDQRGAGRSQPHGLIENNTTQDLLNDMEEIRQRLSIDQWLVFGGSWGAALALLYAQNFASRCLGLVLRGTFLARQIDINWFFDHGANQIFPDYWDDFTSAFEDPKNTPYANQIAQQLKSPEFDIRLQAAKAWSDWAGRVVTWTLEEEEEPGEIDEQRLIRETILEMHYALNHYFIRDNQILEDIGQITEIPVIIIHGRRDMTCTLDASWSVHKALPGSKMTILPRSGHLAGEPAMIDALVGATDKMAEMLK